MRLFSWGAAVVLASMFAGCYSDHRVGDNSLTATDGGGTLQMIPPATIELEIDGMTFQAGCPNGHSGVGLRTGATCGTGGSGVGPTFMTLDCYDTPMEQIRPIYFVGALFRNFNPSAQSDDTTFDLSDPGHEHYITVMLGNQPDLTGIEYEYCSAPPQDLPDGGTWPASSGTVTVHHFAPDMGTSQGAATSHVELSNVVVPTVNGGPTMKVVSAHLYF